MRTRKKPLRTCVGCRQKSDKRELLRIVRTPEGKIEIDPKGKKAGRGTYICKKRSCLEKAAKGKSLEHSLKHPVSPDIIAELAAGLPADDNWRSVMPFACPGGPEKYTCRKSKYEQSAKELPKYCCLYRCQYCPAKKYYDKCNYYQVLLLSLPKKNGRPRTSPRTQPLLTRALPPVCANWQKQRPERANQSE